MAAAAELICLRVNTLIRVPMCPEKSWKMIKKNFGPVKVLK